MKDEKAKYCSSDFEQMKNDNIDLLKLIAAYGS